MRGLWLKQPPLFFSGSHSGPLPPLLGSGSDTFCQCLVCGLVDVKLVGINSTIVFACFFFFVDLQ